MKERKESEVAQSCPTLCNPMDCIPPGSSIHGIFQARMLEWVTISYSRSLSSYSRTDIDQNSRLNLMNSLVLSRFCHVWLFATPWTAAHQAPLSMGFFRQGSWSVLLPLPSPGDLPDPGIEPTSFASPVLAGRVFITAATWEAPIYHSPYPQIPLSEGFGLVNAYFFFRFQPKHNHLLTFQTKRRGYVFP